MAYDPLWSARPGAWLVVRRDGITELCRCTRIWIEHDGVAWWRVKAESGTETFVLGEYTSEGSAVERLEALADRLNRDNTVWR